MPGIRRIPGRLSHLLSSPARRGWIAPEADKDALPPRLVPKIPSTGSPHLILAGMVGTTMAGVCLVTRSYLVAEKGWTLSDLRIENRDSAIALSLTFLLSAAIMACAAATMHAEGIEVNEAIDMVRTLEPLAGRFAMSLFAFGIIAAALSSVFPNYLLGPWEHLKCGDYLMIISINSASNLEDSYAQLYIYSNKTNEWDKIIDLEKKLIVTPANLDYKDYAEKFGDSISSIKHPKYFKAILSTMATDRSTLLRKLNRKLL